MSTGNAASCKGAGMAHDAELKTAKRQLGLINQRDASTIMTACSGSSSISDHEPEPDSPDMIAPTLLPPQSSMPPLAPPHLHCFLSGPFSFRNTPSLALDLQVTMAMAGRVLVAALLVASALAFEAEVKPNNYPNFEFHESPVQETAEVRPHSFATSQFSEGSQEEKPNNYPGFKYTASAEEEEEEGRAHGQFAQLQHHEKTRSGVYGESHAQDGYVYDAHQEQRRGESFYSMGVPVYRGSDASDRNPSSYDLINAKESEEGQFGTSKTADARDDAVAHTQSQGGSSRFYTPSTDTDFVFRFAKPESTEDTPATFSQFSFDDTTTHGTTSSALAKANSGSHGCANMYWAEHTKEWPSFFTVNTQVAQAFGLKAGNIYGTTTLLQALYDNRSDGYSQLLSHGTAALMNSYAMPNYGVRHDAVIDQFLGALASRTAAGVQAQKFFNANHAYGPNECLN